MAILLGTSALGTNGSTWENSGFVLACRYTASISGTITQVNVRSSSSITPAAAGTLTAAIFTNSGSLPVTRIGPASAVLGPQTWATSTWYTLTGLSAPVVNGTQYWIAFLMGGGVRWEFSLNSTAGPEVNAPPGGALLTMPATWPTNNGTFSETLNTYGEEIAAPAPVGGNRLKRWRY